MVLMQKAAERKRHTTYHGHCVGMRAGRSNLHSSWYNSYFVLHVYFYNHLYHAYFHLNTPDYQGIIKSGDIILRLYSTNNYLVVENQR